MRYRPISEEMKANIADDLAIGCTYSEIADRYGVSYSTIKRIKDKLPVSTSTEQKESPEVGSTHGHDTPMENASEDIIDSGSPADTNIITDVPEVVKQEKYSPYNPAVDDAVLERIEKLRTKIEELNHDIVCYEKEISAMMQYHEKCMEAENERNNKNH